MSERNPPVATPGQGSTKRLEALNDGIFAIVMTIIVFGVKVPSGPEQTLLHQLERDVPTFITYGLTFITLGVLWFGNRAQSEYIAVANHPLVWLNLLFLGTVALVPFSAGFLGSYPQSRLAVVEYGLHLTFASLVHGSTWLYVLRHPELLDNELTSRYRKVSRIATFMPAVLYAAGTLCGFFYPPVGLIAYLVIQVPFVSGLYYRRLAKIDSRPSGNL